MTLHELMDYLDQLDISLTVKGDRLHCVPRSAITTQTEAEIRTHKAGLIAKLRPGPDATTSEIQTTTARLRGGDESSVVNPVSCETRGGTIPPQMDSKDLDSEASLDESREISKTLCVHRGITGFADLPTGGLENELRERGFTRVVQFPPVHVNGKGYQYNLWNDELLPDTVLAYDTETELIQEGQTPPMAVAMVHGNAGSCYVIHPDDMRSFVTNHRQCMWVCHNAVFDFWVTQQHLSGGSAESTWWEIAAEGRLCCTMIFNQLIGLAKNDDEPINKGLGYLASSWCGITLDKDDPYRLRYGELIGMSVEEWEDVDQGFWEYGLLDPIATLQLYQAQCEAARRLSAPFKHHKLLPQHEQLYGPLTATLQTRGAIALDAVSRGGVCIDTAYAGQVKDDIAEVVTAAVADLKHLMGASVFHRKASGELSLTPAGAPRRNSKLIKGKLAEIAHQANPPVVPTINKDGLVTDSVKFWKDHKDLDPIVDTYCLFMEQTKLMQFFKSLNADKIFPKYRPMVRTGRTSCSKPNLQQLPRDSKFREMIVPKKDHYLLQVDYSVLELRTLAQVCINLFGKSKMAELFHEGQDLHRYTAAMMLGVTMEQFGDLDPDDQKTARQKAKAINFGVPGGMGAKSLSSHAKAAYGVDMMEEEAKTLKDQLIYRTYPELSEYLEDDRKQNLANNLECTRVVVDDSFPGWNDRMDAERIVAGHEESYGGRKYSAEDKGQMWKRLSEINESHRLQDILLNRVAGIDAIRKIFFGPTVTLSGRIRGHVNFMQTKNTPFQGLAADGNKLAIFNLIKKGYDICGFVHDEVMVNIPKDCDLNDAVEEVQRIMCESMQEFTPDVPIQTSSLLADRWYKDVDDQPVDTAGRIVPYCGNGCAT